LAKVVALVEAELGDKITAHDQAQAAATKALAEVTQQKTALDKERAQHEADKAATARQLGELRLQAEREKQEARAMLEAAAQATAKVKAREQSVAAREAALDAAVSHLSKARAA
jgi:hypothetical protein